MICWALRIEGPPRKGGRRAQTHRSRRLRRPRPSRTRATPLPARTRCSPRRERRSVEGRSRCPASPKGAGDGVPFASLPTLRYGKREPRCADDDEFVARPKNHLPAPTTQRACGTIDDFLERPVVPDASGARQPRDALAAAGLLLTMQVLVQTATPGFHLGCDASMNVPALWFDRRLIERVQGRR